MSTAHVPSSPTGSVLGRRSPPQGQMGPRWNQEVIPPGPTLCPRPYPCFPGGRKALPGFPRARRGPGAATHPTLSGQVQIPL